MTNFTSTTTALYKKFTLIPDSCLTHASEQIKIYCSCNNKLCLQCLPDHYHENMCFQSMSTIADKIHSEVNDLLKMIQKFEETNKRVNGDNTTVLISTLTRIRNEIQSVFSSSKTDLTCDEILQFKRENYKERIISSTQTYYSKTLEENKERIDEMVKTKFSKFTHLFTGKSVILPNENLNTPISNIKIPSKSKSEFIPQEIPQKLIPKKEETDEIVFTGSQIFANSSIPALVDIEKQNLTISNIKTVLREENDKMSDLFESNKENISPLIRMIAPEVEVTNYKIDEKEEKMENEVKNNSAIKVGVNITELNVPISLPLLLPLTTPTQPTLPVQRILLPMMPTYFTQFEFNPTIYNTNFNNSIYSHYNTTNNLNCSQYSQYTNQTEYVQSTLQHSQQVQMQMQSQNKGGKFKNNQKSKNQLNSQIFNKEKKNKTEKKKKKNSNQSSYAQGNEKSSYSTLHTGAVNTPKYAYKSYNNFPSSSTNTNNNPITAGKPTISYNLHFENQNEFLNSSDSPKDKKGGQVKIVCITCRDKFSVFKEETNWRNRCDRCTENLSD